MAPVALSVDVQNGSGRGGEAIAARQGLEAAGFTVTSAGNRPPYDTAATTVEHPPGQEAAAAVVASYVEGGARIRVDAAAGGLILVTGPDFDGIRTTPRAAGGGVTTTTGVPTTTSTTLDEEQRLADFYAGVGAALCHTEG